MLTRLASCLLLIAAMLVLAPVGLRAADVSGRDFDAATRLYERGRYPEALAAYLKLIETGKASPALLYNAGNAAFRTGQMGRALLHYRQAERLAPRDPDIQANLRFARTQVQGGPPPPPPLWRRALPRLTLNQWTIGATVLLWGWLGLWTASHLQPAWGFRLKRARLAAGLLFVFVAAGLFLTWREQGLTKHAVVIQRDAILRHGPLDESPSLQTLPDGQELTVQDQKDDWLQVAGASRGVGWLKQDQVALVQP